MTAKTFEEIVNEQIKRCLSVLVGKGKEYAPGADRLSAFKKAAVIQDCTQLEAALGMMSKHVVSLTDMIHSKGHYTTSRWDEKITDTINYLLIIRAIVEEEENAKNRG